MPKSKFIKNRSEFDVARKLLIDAINGNDNAISRYINLSSDKRKTCWLLLWSFEEASRQYGCDGEEDEVKDNVMEIRKMWRDILEESPYVKEENYKEVFTNGE